MIDRVNKSSQDVDYQAIRQEVESEMDVDSELQARLDAESGELPSLESEIGLDEVDLSEAAIDSLPPDDTDDNFDADDDGMEGEADQEELISDLPQELTQSYGTGLQGQPSDRAGSWSRYSRTEQFTAASPELTGGDIDANYEQAYAVGDEAVGGTVSTPDQDIVDELGAAVGLEMNDRSFLRTNDILEERDDRRWELDPQSSEDYSER
jgi:hypothetical protein